MPAEEGQPDDQPRVTGQVPPPAPTTGLEQILPGRPPLPHAEEKGAFFVYQRELAPGTRLEQYEIIRVLGSGGFGITYLAKDLFLNRNVVIKENFPSRYSYRDPLTGHIRPNNEHDLENYTWALKSFLSEAQTLAELNNPGIVRILSVFEANGTAYFAMEHITGLSLDYLGEKLHSTGHRYTEDELKGLLTRLLRILDYLHSRHIYHRDIKPGNILLTEEGTPVLIDFGAARHALKLHAATVLTTQGYSSPEQALGKTNIGPWSDLYSVGATFYALLTGNPPDRAEARLAEDEMQPLHSDPVLTRYYSRQFLLSLDKALAPQINCRYQTAGEWIHDICAISGEESSATIQVLPADLRHAHPEGMPTPGAGKNIGSRKAATGTDGLHSASRRQSARALRRNRHMMSLLVGSACTILLGAGAFYLLDYMKKAPMGTTINTIKEAIQQPAASSSVGEPEPPPRDLASIRIPELKITEDAALEPRSLTEFRLRLDDTILTRSGLPPILPEKLRISCIYLQIIPPAANGENCTSPSGIPTASWWTAPSMPSPPSRCRGNPPPPSSFPHSRNCPRTEPTRTPLKMPPTRLFPCKWHVSKTRRNVRKKPSRKSVSSLLLPCRNRPCSMTRPTKILWRQSPRPPRRTKIFSTRQVPCRACCRPWSNFPKPATR